MQSGTSIHFQQLLESSRGTCLFLLLGLAILVVNYLKATMLKPEEISGSGLLDVSETNVISYSEI